MKKPLILSILALEIFMILTLSGCVLARFDIAKLRYFVPKNFSVKTYTVEIKPSEFIRSRVALVKKVNALYVSTSTSVMLKAGTFRNSFEMHDFWHRWVKEQSGVWKALKSELWWFSGSFSKNGIRAWYSENTIFLISSSDDSVLNEIRNELKSFVSALSEVRS